MPRNLQLATHCPTTKKFLKPWDCSKSDGLLGSVFLLVAYAGAWYFTGNGIDEATIYHVKYGLGGSGFLEYKRLIAGITGALVLGVVILLWTVAKRQGKGNTKAIYNIVLYLCAAVSLLLNPAIIDLYNLNKDIVGSILKLSPDGFANFEAHYKKPFIKETSKAKKNFVFIYAESLERTYFDENIFPGLITGLRELESKSMHFTDIRQVEGTGWTVAGMTASQCGLPLFSPSHGNSMSGMDQFLTSAVCLGDLLNDNGYQLDFIGGASLEFAGKGKLLESHGFTQVSGRDELLPKLDNKEYRTGWGLYDDTLFDLTYRRFIELSKAGDKFGLFTLTLDTHHPNGHPSGSCKGREYKDASNPILNAVVCSDYLITTFVKKIMNSSYAKNTVIVIMSDHLAMRNTAFDRLLRAERRNLFMIIDPASHTSVKTDTAGSTLDIGATLLPLLGYAGDIGLGRNLLNSQLPELERLFIHSRLPEWKKPVIEFWDFPDMNESLEVNIDEGYVGIDNRDLKIPLLIELDDESVTAVKFEFDRSAEHKSLIQYRKELPDEKYFLLIDRCEKVKELHQSLGGHGFCLLAGQGSNYSRLMKLNDNLTLSADETRQLLTLH